MRCLDQNQVPYHLATPHRVGSPKSYHAGLIRLSSALERVNFVTNGWLSAYLGRLSGAKMTRLFH